MPAVYEQLPDLELKLRSAPKLFWEEIENLPFGSSVVVDEIQRLPLLLDYVQMGIDQKNIRLLLSGSSARKLKRGAIRRNSRVMVSNYVLGLMKRVVRRI